MISELVTCSVVAVQAFVILVLMGAPFKTQLNSLITELGGTILP